MDYVRKGPTPLAIRANRDAPQAMGDLLAWVSKSRGKDEQDPQDANEARDLYNVWQAQRNNGDGVLFERNAAMDVKCSVFHLKEQPVTG